MKDMNRTLIPFLVLITLFSCSKQENELFTFEKTWQSGSAEDVAVTADSMYLIAGNAQGFPFIIKVNRSGSRIMEYISDLSGSFTSVIGDTSGYYACGYSNGDIIITKVKPDGSKVWSVLIETFANTANAVILKKTDNSFLVSGSCDADSLDSDTFDLVEVDREGNVLSEKQIQPGYNIAVSDIAYEVSGNLFLAIAKNVTGSKSKASVAELTPDGNFLWETELYNNANFAAACLSIAVGDNGNIYLTGRTELKIEDNTLENSFLASVGQDGNVIRKEYLENSNRGVDLVFDDLDRVHMLNRNCFIINILGLTLDSDESRIRTFEVCDPYQTGAKATSLKINPENDYILCGSKSGKVYYALRKGEEGDVPVQE